MWLQNGRAILNDGRAVLCSECPCGCRYTYYVDHSLETSGDGHSWETAFNSVNDAFNSLEISNYRISGCKIFVKIRGTITYYLSGAYSSASPGKIVLRPEYDDGRVTADFGYQYNNTMHISNAVFDKWDISVTSTIAGNPGGVFDLSGDCSFQNCTMDCNFEWGSSYFEYAVIYSAGSILTINNCEFNLSISRSGSSLWSSNISLIQKSSTGTSLIVKDTTINLKTTGLANNANVSLSGIVSTAVSGACVLENVTVNFDISTSYNSSKYIRFLAYAFNLTTYGAVSSCGGLFDISVGTSKYIACRFYTAGTSTVFYNCTQYCVVYGAGMTCDDCAELS